MKTRRSTTNKLTTMTTQIQPNIEYIFGKNRYNHPIMYTRKIGTIKYTCGYPYSLHGWTELERGKTIGGPCLIKFYNALRSKYADQLTGTIVDK